MPGTQRLAAALRTAIKTGGRFQGEIAQSAGIDYSGLRKALSRNEFYEDELEALGSVLREFQMPITELRRRFEFTVLPGKRGARKVVSRHLAKKAIGSEDLPGAFDVLMAKASRVRGVIATMDRTVRLLYASMGRDDLLVLVLSDDPAIEWIEGPDGALFTDVANAVSSGASICYVFPSQAVVEEVLTRQAALNAKLPTVFKRFFSDFKARIARTSQGRSTKRSSAPGRIAAIEHNAPAYFAPGHKFALYVHAAKERTRYWGTAAYPIATGRYTGEPVADRLILPLTQDVSNQLFTFCRVTVEQAKAAEAARIKALRSPTASDKEAINDLSRILSVLEGHPNES